jgi:hypothetical protein
MTFLARGQDDDSGGESDVARHRIEIERWDRRRQAGWGFRTKHKSERKPPQVEQALPASSVSAVAGSDEGVLPDMR